MPFGAYKSSFPNWKQWNLSCSTLDVFFSASRFWNASCWETFLNGWITSGQSLIFIPHCRLFACNFVWMPQHDIMLHLHRCRSYKSFFKLPQLAFLQLPFSECEQIQKVGCLNSIIIAWMKGHYKHGTGFSRTEIDIFNPMPWRTYCYLQP